jgi:hypothetical protein
MADPKDELIAKLQTQVQKLKEKIMMLDYCKGRLYSESYRDNGSLEGLLKNTRENMYLWRERANTFEVLLREIGYNIEKTVDIGRPIDDDQDRSVLDETEFSKKRPRRERIFKEFNERLQDISNDLQCMAKH